MISIAFTKVMRLWLASGLAHWRYPGITECTGADPGRLINMRACGWPALGAGYRDSCRFCRNGNGPVPLDRRHALSIRMFLRADWEHRRETTLRFLLAPSPWWGRPRRPLARLQPLACSASRGVP